MSETCPQPGDLVEIELARIATQYREAERFKGYLRVILNQVDAAARAACAIPSFFDLRNAAGDQLTLLGKRLGFPRCHCVCDFAPVFGFACDDLTSTIAITGFCEEGSTWANCHEVGQGQLCLQDDEVYRAHLLARRYQMLGLFDEDSLSASVRLLWGEQASVIPFAGYVVLRPGRALSSDETARLSVTLRVLPVAPGISIRMQYGAAPIFGFGAGWSGFCAGAWLCPVPIDPYSCS